MNENYWDRLRNFWFPSWWNLGWLLLGLPALYFLQTLVHEGSHAMAGLFSTGSFPKLFPFPHYDASAGFRNGVTFTGDGFIATPQFVALTLILIFMAIFIFWPISNRVARFVLRFLFLGVCIDLLYNTVKGLWGGSSPFSDWGRFQVSIGTGGIIALSWVIWLLVLSHFVWVYYCAWQQNREEEAGFWDFRWIALAFGLLSLTSLMFAAFVSDPDIDKGHPVFIVAVIMQVLAVIGYGVYFGVSFSQR